jgi:hypothetical protein
VAFGGARDWDAECGVENGEHWAAKKPEHEVGDAKIFADGFADDGDQQAVDEVEGVDDDEDAEDVGAVGFGAVAGESWRCGRVAQVVLPLIVGAVVAGRDVAVKRS